MWRTVTIRLSALRNFNTTSFISSGCGTALDKLPTMFNVGRRRGKDPRAIRHNTNVMLKTYRNKLAMYKAVETVLIANGQSWSGIPAFTTAKVLFTDKMSLLTSHVYEQETALRGVTINKRQKRFEAAEIAVEIARAICAYATAINNPGLAKSMRIFHSRIMYTSHLNSLNIISEVIDKASTHIASLGDYGIDQTKVDALIAIHGELLEIIGTPRMAILSRKGSTQMIKSTIQDIDGILRGQIDNLVESIKSMAPEFYLHYFNARQIYDHGKRHNSENGSLTENDGYGGEE
ncbi:MAG: hypothetical protein QNK23_13570 [Crocinitomicaceae bacterium]|nr:hypothetical protein [Crocinitomicaceae bacterium]